MPTTGPKIVEQPSHGGTPFGKNSSTARTVRACEWLADSSSTASHQRETQTGIERKLILVNATRAACH